MGAAYIKVVRKEREKGRERGDRNMRGDEKLFKDTYIDLHLPTSPHFLSLQIYSPMDFQPRPSSQQLC